MSAGLRSSRERLIQTLCFEGVGLVVVAPLYAWVAGAGLGESLAMIAAVSATVMAWAAAFNTVFDRIEHARTGRVASDRPHRWRTVHALALEASAALVSCPVIYAMTPLSWAQALLADLGLTLVYAVYGYLFHWVFDRLRPVGRVPG
jgi:uncharacterized membrane protein